MIWLIKIQYILFLFDVNSLIRLVESCFKSSKNPLISFVADMSQNHLLQINKIKEMGKKKDQDDLLG